MARKVAGVFGLISWTALLGFLWFYEPSAAEAGTLFDNMPAGWKVGQTVLVGAEQRQAIATKLGAKINKLTNTVVEYDGKQAQVNVIYCPTAADAVTESMAIVQAHNGDSIYATVVGSTAVEFAKTSDAEFVKELRRTLNLSSLGLDMFTAKYIKRIPPEWRLESSFVVPREQKAAISEKLGGKIDKMSNTTFFNAGQAVKVNVMRCVSAEEAKKIQRNIEKIKPDPAFCLVLNDSLVEFVCQDANTAKSAVEELGIRPGQAQAADVNSIPGNNLEGIARNYVTLLVNKQFEDAAKEFDSTMKTALPVSKLKDAWNSAAAPMGQFKEQGAARQEKVMGYDVVFVTCLFEKGKFDVKLVYNKSRQISGLFFVPTRD
jgi:hypothetical protein